MYGYCTSKFQMTVAPQTRVDGNDGEAARRVEDAMSLRYRWTFECAHVCAAVFACNVQRCATKDFRLQHSQSA